MDSKSLDKFNKLQGTVKVDKLIDLAEYYFDRDVHRSIEFSQQAKELAENIDYYKVKFKILIFQGKCQARIGNFDKALKIMTAAIEYCHAGSRDLAELSNDIGLILYHLSRYNESIGHIEKAIEISQRNKYQDVLAKAYNNLAMNLNCLGKYDQALKEAFKALKLKQDIPNFSETSIANTYTVIGDIYRRMNKLYDSIDYHTKALKIYNKQNNISGKAGQICNIGSIYYHLKEFNKAMDNFKEALKLSEKSGNKEFTANIIYNLGSVYRDIGDLNRAFEMYNKSILMNRDMGDTNAVADALIEISIIYSTQNNDDKALKTNMKAQKIANKINDRKLHKNLHERFYEIYKSMGQFEKSLYHYKIYLKIKQEMSINTESS